MKTIGILARCRCSPRDRFDRQRAEPEPFQPDHLRRPLQHQLKLPEPLGLPGRLWLGLWQHLHRRPHRRHELRRHVSQTQRSQARAALTSLLGWAGRRWSRSRRRRCLPTRRGRVVAGGRAALGRAEEDKAEDHQRGRDNQRKAPDRYAATIGNACWPANRLIGRHARRVIRVHVRHCILQNVGLEDATRRGINWFDRNPAARSRYRGSAVQDRLRSSRRRTS